MRCATVGGGVRSAITSPAINMMAPRRGLQKRILCRATACCSHLLPGRESRAALKMAAASNDMIKIVAKALCPRSVWAERQHVWRWSLSVANPWITHQRPRCKTVQDEPILV